MALRVALSVPEMAKPCVMLYFSATTTSDATNSMLLCALGLPDAVAADGEADRPLR